MRFEFLTSSILGPKTLKISFGASLSISRNYLVNSLSSNRRVRYVPRYRSWNFSISWNFMLPRVVMIMSHILVWRRMSRSGELEEMAPAWPLLRAGGHNTFKRYTNSSWSFEKESRFLTSRCQRSGYDLPSSQNKSRQWAWGEAKFMEMLWIWGCGLALVQAERLVQNLDT